MIDSDSRNTLIGIIIYILPCVLVSIKCMEFTGEWNVTSQIFIIIFSFLIITGLWCWMDPIGSAFNMVETRNIGDIYRVDNNYNLVKVK
jgi:ethanolamine transporter EutH